MTDVVTQPETLPGATGHKPVHTRAVIIGTGFSGLGMAIALQKQGIGFVILEKAGDIGAPLAGIDVLVSGVGSCGNLCSSLLDMQPAEADR